MDPIVLATPEQVERIKKEADLNASAIVYAMGEDLIVFKHQLLLDPVFFEEDSSPSRRLMLIWGMENILRSTGADAYYFNIRAEDEKWKHVSETHGAEQISQGPEYRMKKLL